MNRPRRRKTAKAVGLCALVFATVSAFSMGMAAFITSAGAKAAQGGNVSVGVIEKNNVRFESTSGGDLKDFTPVSQDDDLYNVISFDAPLDDDSGRFRYEDRGDGLYEHLTVRLEGRVMPMNFIQKATVKMTCVSSYSESATPIQDAIDLGYIKLKTWDGGGDYLSSAVELPLTSYREKDDSKLFSVPIGFDWGDVFGGDNPTVFYDNKNEGGGASISDDVAVKTMKDFIRVIHYGKEYTGEVPSDPKLLPTLTFSVKLTAEIN